jgi:hypothetical protein
MLWEISSRSKIGIWKWISLMTTNCSKNLLLKILLHLLELQAFCMKLSKKVFLFWGTNWHPRHSLLKPWTCYKFNKFPTIFWKILEPELEVLSQNVFLVVGFLHTNTLFNKVGTSYINALFLLLLIRWGASQISPFFSSFLQWDIFIGSSPKNKLKKYTGHLAISL